jgi:hypothetical protein
MDKNQSESDKKLAFLGLLISLGLVLANSPSASALNLRTGETETNSIAHNLRTNDAAKSFSLDSLLSAAAESGFDFLYGNLAELLEQIINDVFPSSANVAIDLGSLGLPDPDLLEDNVEDYLKDNSGAKIGVLDELFGGKIGGSASSELKNTLSQDFLISLAKETIKKGTLSKEAQQKSKQKLEASTQVLQENQTLAEDSASQDVSQNILRNVSKQIAKQTQLNDLVYQELQKSQTTQALNTEMTAEAVEEIAGTNTKETRQVIGDFQQSINHQYLFSMPGKKFADKKTGESS